MKTVYYNSRAAIPTNPAITATPLTMFVAAAPPGTNGTGVLEGETVVLVELLVALPPLTSSKLAQFRRVVLAL